MNQIWLQIVVVMVGSSIVKYLFTNPFAWVCIDVTVLAICYMILRRNPYIDLKASMLFLSGLTIVSVLTDLDIISALVGNIFILVILAWMMFGRSSGNNVPRRPKVRHKWHK